jgi:lipoate-protein ligase A
MIHPTWRLLMDSPADAARNMAVDESILRAADAAPEHTAPTLRFYAWQPPAVSIGYAQSASEFDVAGLQQQGRGFVRRLTGGGALFHHEEFTFSWVASAAAGDVPLDTGGVYEWVNRGLVAGLGELGIEARPRGCGSGNREDLAAFCTVRKSPYDLVVGGQKLVGTAQRWTKRVVLEHGFVPLEPNPMTPEILCLRQLLGRLVPFGEVAQAMIRGFERALGCHLVPDGLRSEEVLRLPELTLKYSSREWNCRL